MKKLLLISFTFIIASCSSIKVTYDYDKEVDFSQYKTYNFDKETLELPINQLNRDRLLAAIDNEMTKKGFTKSDNPDVIVHVVAKVETKMQATANTTGSGVGYGYGRWGGYGYGGGFSTTTIDYDEYHDGTLFISLIDRSSEKIIWQGVATKTLNESASAEKKEKNINYSMERVFYKYPPGK